MPINSESGGEMTEQEARRGPTSREGRGSCELRELVAGAPG